MTWFKPRLLCRVVRKNGTANYSSFTNICTGGEGGIRHYDTKDLINGEASGRRRRISSIYLRVLCIYISSPLSRTLSSLRSTAAKSLTMTSPRPHHSLSAAPPQIVWVFSIIRGFDISFLVTGSPPPVSAAPVLVLRPFPCDCLACLRFLVNVPQVDPGR